MKKAEIFNVNEHETYGLKCKALYYPVHVCPLCHSGFSNTPTKYTLTFSERQNKLFLFCFHVCMVCDRGFIAEYRADADIAPDYRNDYQADFGECSETYPSELFQKEFAEEINTLSPSFVKIYNEAYSAEQSRLYEICGMGYRKALEFLIKDYLTHKFPDQSDEIKEDSLGNCIKKKEYGFDEKVKSVAERCAWLGNDHSHYIAKHTDKDLDDLKKLLNMTVTWITLLVQSEEALKIEKK